MTDTTIRIFEVLAYRQSDVTARLTSLAKRAARKGIPFPTWAWGKAFTQKERMPHPEFGNAVDYSGNVTRIPLTLTGEPCRFAGWTFVATLDFLPTDSGERAVFFRAIEGSEVPASYRQADPNCDHCKARRNRSKCYVLRHVDGRHVQVGSTCVVDFLGDKAEDVAASACALADACAFIDDDSMGGGMGGGAASFTLDAFLPVVAACMRVDGWLSRTKARETGASATADIAWECVTFPGGKGAKRIGTPTAEDTARAEAAIAWADALTEASVNGNDYLSNVRPVAMANLADRRTMGIAASIIGAYEREEAKKIERAKSVLSVHVGTVGGDVSDDLTLAYQTTYDTSFGTTHVYRFLDGNGNTLVWKASSGQGLTQGVRYFVRGTIKAHDDYKGVKQTLLTRCAVFPRSCTCPKCSGTGKAKRGGTCKGCNGHGRVGDVTPAATAEVEAMAS